MPAKGYHQSEDAKKAISVARRLSRGSYVLKDDHKNRISEGLREAYAEGRRVRTEWHHTVDSKRRIGIGSKNRVRGVEVRKAISESHKLNTDNIMRLRCSMREMMNNPERKLLMKEACIKRNSSEEMRSVSRRRAIEHNKNRGMTNIELKVANQLQELGIEFEYQFVADNMFVYDFRIGELLIECDGGWWHLMPKVREQDTKKDLWALENGFKLLRMSEKDILCDEFCIEKKIVGVQNG